MKTNPHRPLTFQGQRLPLPVQNAPGKTLGEEPKRPPAQQEPGQAQASKEAAESNSCKFPAGIKTLNHPTMPNTQAVAIPNNANIRSIITALTAKGKESSSTGPNKLILISCGGAPTHPPRSQAQAQTSNDPKRTEVVTKTLGSKLAARDMNLCAGNETAGCTLDNSLTNIQWLGKRSLDGLGSSSIKQEMEEKENRISILAGLSERPPYSYMAMIQFAINSTERKHMTLKGIYTWIEDHFPYFKHIAKPGWKNSISHLKKKKKKKTKQENTTKTILEAEQPGIESQVGLPAWSLLLPLPVSLPLSLSVNEVVLGYLAASVHISTNSARGFPFLHILSNICCFLSC
ncbi:unnamed protein product [Nyctereutes procyonoides]|uniref:(raccoon dog) hypothetical protein n=1 Tax=Nyctereutes procyonoides TaxID=34880 RepID=A0A811ZN52_NYCPR|nr:unnamed protein product [Nyctereutes procyonoides]